MYGWRNDVVKAALERNEAAGEEVFGIKNEIEKIYIEVNELFGRELNQDADVNRKLF